MGMEQSSPKKTIALQETVYLVEPGRRVREAQVWGRSGSLYTVRFTDTGGGIRVRRDRLFLTREAARAALRQKKAEKQQTRPTPGYWHNVPVWEC